MRRVFPQPRKANQTSQVPRKRLMKASAAAYRGRQDSNNRGSDEDELESDAGDRASSSSEPDVKTETTSSEESSSECRDENNTSDSEQSKALRKAGTKSSSKSMQDSDSDSDSSSDSKSCSDPKEVTKLKDFDIDEPKTLRRKVSPEATAVREQSKQDEAEDHGTNVAPETGALDTSSVGQDRSSKREADMMDVDETASKGAVEAKSSVSTRGNDVTCQLRTESSLEEEERLRSERQKPFREMEGWPEDLVERFEKHHLRTPQDLIDAGITDDDLVDILEFVVDEEPLETDPKDHFTKVEAYMAKKRFSEVMERAEAEVAARKKSVSGQ